MWKLWRAKVTKPVEVEQDDNRELFHYFDGEKDRRIDPLLAWDKIWTPKVSTETPLGPDEHDCVYDLDSFPALGLVKPSAGQNGPLEPMDTSTPEAYADHSTARKRFLRMIQVVFGTKEFDDVTGFGLTIDERIGLCLRFMAYMGELKKSTEQPPMPSAPSGSATSENSTTKPESDSSSINGVLTGGEPS